VSHFRHKPLELKFPGLPRSVPVRAYAAQQRRVHDQFSERVGCRHVEGCQPADAADVDSKVKAVAIRGFNQRARWRERSRPIGIGEPVGERRCGMRRRSWAVPPEEASDKKT
jgi:hypothetical protein